MLRNILGIFILVLPISAAASEELQTEALRSALSICSQGKVETSSATGGIEGFVGLLKRNVEAGAGGEVTSSELGAILDKTYSEDVRFEAYKIYNDCLINFILPLVTGSNANGPGIQTTDSFVAIGRRATAVGKLVFVEFSISGRSNRNPRGWWTIETQSFRGISTSGGVYKLSDAAGLDQNFRLKDGDTYNPIFTFELIAGEPANKVVSSTFSFTGSIAYHLNNNSRDGMQIGLRDLPIAAS